MVTIRELCAEDVNDRVKWRYGKRIADGKTVGRKSKKKKKKMK